MRIEPAAANASSFHIPPSSIATFPRPLEGRVRAARKGAGGNRARDAILVPIGQLRPTQVTVGMRAVAAKRKRVEDRTTKRKKMMRFLEKRPIPAVLGPASGFYIIDHHHLSLALWQSDVREAYVQIVGDMSGLAGGAFWTEMQRSGWMYPFDETGQQVTPCELPPAIAALRSDHYRDLAWSVRERGGFKKTRAPFAEFKWAQYFREHIALADLEHEYDRALRRAMKLAGDRAAATLPGFRKS